MATFTLNVKETGNKAAKFHYTVTDENGTVISERKSNRVYVACTATGGFYYGRLDLVTKGDRMKIIQQLQDRIANRHPKEWLSEAELKSQLHAYNQIAYVK